jgi:hypothetical protein
MQITLYENFAKKDNSTLTPNIRGTNVNCALKNSTSISNPTFILTVENFNISYVKWDERYYYVTDISSLRNGVIELSCTIDVLATYKKQILQTTAYIECSTSKFNSNLLDTRIPNTGNVIQSVASSKDIETFSQSGCYCLTIIGSGGSNTEQRFVTRQGLNNLSDNISQITDEDVINGLVLKFGSVFGTITGCTFLPFSLPNGTNELIKIGDYTTGTDSIVASSLVSLETKTINIPWIYTIPRRMTESLNIYLPCVGNVPLDPSQFLNDTTLTIYCIFDYVTGELIYLLTNGKIFLKYNTQCGTPIQFAFNSQSRTTGVLSTIFEKVKEWSDSGLDLSNVGADVLSTRNENLIKTFSRLGTSYNVIGSNGSFANGILASSRNNIVISSSAFGFSTTQESIRSIKGSPFMSVSSLSDINGFCKCNGASVSVSCEENERNKINNYLNSGFFIE